jgi:hypothetical protein
LTARVGKDSGGTPPPVPGVCSSSDGPTRRRCLRPVARRRSWRCRTRASGEKRGCLGACWGWCAFIRVLGRGFYRPGGRGRGRPVGGLRRGSWRRVSVMPGAAALLACWRGLVAATGYCGSALARSQRSTSCREQLDREGGPGVFFLLSSKSHGSGRGRGGWARPRRLPRHGYRVRAKVNSEAHSRTDFSRFLPTRCSIKFPQEFEFQNFENGHCGSSTYWTRVPGIFLLQRKMVFCKNQISNFGYCHCFRFNLWLMFGLA